jgi:hypothetical protein
MTDQPTNHQPLQRTPSDESAWIIRPVSGGSGDDAPDVDGGEPEDIDSIEDIRLLLSAMRDFRRGEVPVGVLAICKRLQACGKYTGPEDACPRLRICDEYNVLPGPIVTA